MSRNPILDVFCPIMPLLGIKHNECLPFPLDVTCDEDETYFLRKYVEQEAEFERQYMLELVDKTPELYDSDYVKTVNFCYSVIFGGGDAREAENYSVVCNRRKGAGG